MKSDFIKRVLPGRLALMLVTVLSGSGMAYGWNTLTPLTNVVVCPGENAAFSTVAAGAKPWKFSWYKDGVLLPGRTNSSLTLSNVSVASVGTYTVILQGGLNNVTNSATLALKTPVGITPLTSLVRSIGANAVFSTVASGTGPFTYAWTKNGTNLIGKTQSSLTLTNLNLNDSGTYAVIVNGACGSSATSSATLMVDTCFPAVDVLLVLDRSGSMTGKPYDDARQAATNFVHNLHMTANSDQAGLVSYNSSATLDQMLTNSVPAMEQAIHSIPAANGYTSISLGLQYGQAELASVRHNPQALPVLVLLSDGLPTGSDTKSNALYMATQAKNAGTRVFTVGFGGVDPALMAGIASSTNDYFYATNSAQLTALFNAISTVICRPPTNHPPVAVNDSYSTPQDTALTVPGPGVLANDSDPDGNPLTSLLATGASHGSLIFGTNGGFVYTPAGGYFGPDSFTYRARDGQTNSGAATVSITVTPVNHAPVASNDSYIMPEDTVLNIGAPGVLANDIDADGNALTAAPVTSPIHGALTLNTNGSFVYTPTPGYFGPDSFTYQASDGQTNSGVATVSLTITPVNHPPVANNDAYIMPEDTTLNLSAPGVLANDTDPDGNVLTAALVTGPAHGTVILNANGSFSYTPAALYFGSDSFTYRANDGLISSGAATVSLTITPVNHAPVANNDTYTTPEDTTLNISVPGVLANDVDVDGNVLTVTPAAGPAHGTLVFNPNGSFLYTPNANYHGPDSFTYGAFDGQTNSALATVSISVIPVNDAPVANDQSLTTAEDTVLPISLTGTDVDGDAITYAIVAGPTNGLLSLLDTNTGAVLYTPAANYNGPDSFTFRVNDGQADSALATVSITVTPVNDAPVANDQNLTTAEDTVLPISLTGTDVDGDAITYAIVAGPTNGLLSLLDTNTGAVLYTPAANYNGPDSFTFRVNDGQADSALATVSITVTPVDDLPMTNNWHGEFTTLEDTVLNVGAPGLLDGITDIDHRGLRIVLIRNLAHGVLNLLTNGGFSYTPEANFNGSESFQIQVTAGEASTPTLTANITVVPVNDAPSFTKGPDRLVPENSGLAIVPGWATAISAGPADESAQGINFLVSNDQPALFSAQPAINGSGALQFTPAPNAFGVATVTVLAHDNGGTANGGVDTSAPQTFKIIINAPPTVSLVNPADGAIFIAPAAFALAAEAQDADGSVTNVEFFLATTNKIAETALGNPYFTNLFNLPAGTNVYTARATDNYGATGTSAPVRVIILARPPLTNISTIHFNPQTGLYEQSVRVSNPTYSTFDAVRIYILNLTNKATVYNPSGATNGIPYVQSSVPVPPGSHVDFVIEYHVTGAGVVPNPTLQAELVPVGRGSVSVVGTGLHINRGFLRPDRNFLVEFATVTNRVYYVQYSSDLVNWKTAMPAIPGNGTWIQWVDNGQPKTESAPPATSLRFYRVILLP